MTAREILSEAERSAILAAVETAETQTSGEIRVHIDTTCPGDPLERAGVIFQQLEMHCTDLRNGVLIYVALTDRKLAIVGDEGIDKVVPEHFWEVVRDTMIAHFRKGEMAEGIAAAVLEAGIQLKTHFPLSADDRNELSNDLSFDDEAEK